MLIDNICERSLSVSPKRFCMLSNLLRYFLWSNNILQSELLMILSFTIGEEINILYLLRDYNRFPEILSDGLVQIFM